MAKLDQVTVKAGSEEGDEAIGVSILRRALEADTHALTLHLAGTFTPTPEMWQEGDRAGAEAWSRRAHQLSRWVQ